MPASPSNDNANGQAGDARLWQRQLERERLAGLVTADERPAEKAAPPAPKKGRAAAGPSDWKRELEHQRLSALALPGGDYPGPGAAGGISPLDQAAILKDAPQRLKDGKKFSQIISSRNNLWQIVTQDYTLLMSALILPVIFGHMITYNGWLKKTAPSLAEFMKAAHLEKLPGQVGAAARIIKLYLEHYGKVTVAEQFQWFMTCVFVYGTLLIMYLLLGTVAHCYFHPLDCSQAIFGSITG